VQYLSWISALAFFATAIHPLMAQDQKFDSLQMRDVVAVKVPVDVGTAAKRLSSSCPSRAILQVAVAITGEAKP